MNQPHSDQMVALFDENYLSWGFDDRGPAYSLKFSGAWTRVEVDPTPCYHHDVSLVMSELAHCRRLMPLPIPLMVAVLSHECRGRSNGTYYDLTGYDADDYSKNWPAGIIVLSGKRIPIHPAMTRYLVAHEYGHAVQYCWERFKGLKADEMESAFYKALRPTVRDEYGPRKWHANVGELIANDFRVLVAQREVEFWPHEGFARPEDIPKVRQFWAQVQLDMFGDLNLPPKLATDADISALTNTSSGLD